MDSERRTYNRLRRSIFFRIPSLDLKVQPSVDISMGGLLIEMNKPCKEDANFDLELIIPNEEPISCSARVAWVYPKNRGATFYKTGLQFLNLTPKDQSRLKKVIS